MTGNGDMARRLARQIAVIRWRLDREEDAACAARRRRAYRANRAERYRREDRARVDGMTEGLTYLLGQPGNRKAAEEFITETTGPGQAGCQA